jgi:cytoskeletal protein RodZ
MGAVGMGVGDRPTTVLDRGAMPARASRSGYGAEPPAPGPGSPRKGRTALFILGTLILAAIVAFVVIQTVKVPDVPETTLPPISTQPPPPSNTVAPTTSLPETTAPPTTQATTTTQAPTTTTPPTTDQQNEQVRVPDTRGMRVSQATSVLQEAGFEVSRQDFPNPDRRQAFRVIEQVPRNGRAQRGSTVTIVVAVPPNNNG